MMSRIGVFVSGRGSNLAALHAHLERTGTATVDFVASDRATSGAIAWARERGIPHAVIVDEAGAPREILSLLRASGVELVVLAGYLRLVPADVVRAYRGRMVNVHPALLPSFGGPGMYGVRVHRAVLEAGARVSGPTVHFVDEIYDHGAIIAQWPVPVFPDDTEAALAARVLRAEHLLLPRVVQQVAAGTVRLDEGGRVMTAHREVSPERAAFIFDTAEEEALADSMALALGG
jgi:formyltetrahydrofolate-dependent phosphoribosylglycinamide formyltransferase